MTYFHILYIRQIVVGYVSPTTHRDKGKSPSGCFYLPFLGLCVHKDDCIVSIPVALDYNIDQEWTINKLHNSTARAENQKFD